MALREIQNISTESIVFRDHDYVSASERYNSYNPEYKNINDSFNDTADQNDISLYWKVPIASVMSFVSILTLCGNLLVIYAIKTERRLQTVSNYFICSLAVADFLIGVYVMPMSIIYFVGNFKWRYGLILCQMWLSVDYVSSTSSILNLFILSLDRYWSVRNPLQYMRKRTAKRAAIMISIVWCLSCLWILAIAFWHQIMNNGVRVVPEDDCDTEFYANQYFKVLTALVNFYFPLFFMTLLYGSIYHQIRKRSQMEVGNMNTARTCNDKYTSSRIQADLDAENGAIEGLLDPKQKEVWNQDFDSGSSSRNTSGDSEMQTDSVESSRLSEKRKPKIDNQLRSISQMAFVTTGIAGFIHYPDGTADDVASRYFPLNGNSHVPTLMKVQEVSNEVDNSQSEHRGSSEGRDSSDPKGSDFNSNKHERIALRDFKSAPESRKNIPSPRKSILRQTNSCSDTDRVRLSSKSTPDRKISFSLESSSRNRKNASRGELQPLSSRQDSIASGVTSMRKVHRIKSRFHDGPRYSLPNGNHDTLTRSASCNDDRPDLDSQHSLLSHFKVSFARFSVRKNRTQEVLRKRIKRFSVHRERKAVKQLGIIVGCFVTCWLPYFISFLIIAFKPHLIPPTVHYALIWLGYLNSTLNPFIYPMCNGNFRKAFRRILRIPAT